MNGSAKLQRLPEFDDPWRRLPWVTVAAIAIWIGLLAAFSFLLERAEPPQPNMKPIQARIVELPPEVGGLQGGGGRASAKPAQPALSPPKAVPAPRPKTVTTPKKKIEAPPMPVSPNGVRKTEPTSPAPEEASAGTSGSGKSPGGGGGTSGGEGGGSGGVGGIGSDSLGARALFSPTPEIPDDLREDVMQAVAEAHFKVGSDGQVEVALVTRTSNPRLNQILIDTLKEWRFFPAMRNGVAIDSEFDLKIPISVQ